MVVTAQLMVTLDTSVVTIALPSAQHAVGLSDTSRQWIVTGYTLAFGGLLLLGGRIGDLIGRRRALVIGVVGFAVASALGGAAVDSTMLIGARALQGVFAAMLAPSTLSLLTVTFVDPKERARAFGVFSAGLMSGVAVGLVVGGVFNECLSWRWCLYINIPIAIAVVIGAVIVLPNPARNPGATLDIPGTILGCAGVVALVYALGEASSYGWGSPLIIGLLVCATVLLAAFALVQSTVSSPVLPLRVLANRNRAGSFLAIAFSTFGMLAAFLFMTFQLQTVMHYSSVTTGVGFLAYAVAMAITSTQITARLLPRVPPRALVATGLVLVAAGLLLLTQLTPTSSYTGHVLPSRILFGLGVGSLVAPAMSTATSVGDPRDAGVAAAFVNTSQQVGGSIGTAVLNTLAASAALSYLAAHRGSAPALAATHGYAVASAWGSAIVLVGAILVGVLINARSPRHVD